MNTLITLHPLLGIDIEAVGSLRFGQPRSAVAELLGAPAERSDRVDYYPERGLHVYYDFEQAIEFFDIPDAFDSRCQVRLYGINPFALKAEDLLHLLREKNQGEVRDRNAPHSYRFLELSLNVWRDVSEEEVLALLAEFPQSREHLLPELAKAPYFWAIGIGAKDCYRQPPPRRCLP